VERRLLKLQYWVRDGGPYCGHLALAPPVVDFLGGHVFYFWVFFVDVEDFGGGCGWGGGSDGSSALAVSVVEWSGGVGARLGTIFI